MSLIESNSSKLNLITGASFQGKPFKPSSDFITIQVTATFSGGNSGILEIYYSIDGIFYDTYGDSWTFTTETTDIHIFKETQLKGTHFYVKWTNNGISDYTYFNLFSKLTTTTSSVSINGVVDISGGSSGGGGLVQIQGYNGEDWENVTATMGSLAVNDYQGNTKLDTLIDKKLNYDVDNVSVNKVVEPITYDLNNLGEAMYADSINTAYPDPFGRDGWYWSNTLATGASNVYWYSNTPAQVTQNFMTKAQMDCVFVILALDRVEPNIVLPFLNFYSTATGIGDIRPLFAHSFWTYTIDTTVSRLNAGEVVMLVFGDSSKVANLRPELRRVPLILNSTGGEALQTENIAFISLNTDSANKPIGSIQYLLQYAGFHYSVTDKIVQYEFNNSLKRIAENNLSGAVSASGQPNINVNVNTGGFPLTVTYDNDLRVIDTTLNNKINNNATYPTAIDVVVLSGGGGGGGDGIIQGTTPANPTFGLNLSCSVYNDGTNNHNTLETQSNVYGYDSATGLYQPIGVHATNMLRTQACVHTSSGQDISGTVINTVRGLNTYDVGNENLGTFGNIVNGTTLTTLTASSGLNINKTYLNESVIVYEDTNTNLTGGIVVQVSQDDTTYYSLATLFPVTSQAGKRATSSKLLLKPFNYVRILNNSASTYNNVICSLFSS